MTEGGASSLEGASGRLDVPMGQPWMDQLAGTGISEGDAEPPPPSERIARTDIRLSSERRGRRDWTEPDARQGQSAELAGVHRSRSTTRWRNSGGWPVRPPGQMV